MFALISLGLCLPGEVNAQVAGSAIAGVVRDSTGGVLPGVTVEASSPALIEGVRAGVSDGNGNYRVVELRPGTYNITFRLPGFSTVIREDLVLPGGGFTATVNVELAVGSLEETITVAGDSPVVDIQNVQSNNVMSREELDRIPVTRSVAGIAGITLGAMLNETRVKLSQAQGSQSMAVGAMIKNFYSMECLPRTRVSVAIPIGMPSMQLPHKKQSTQQAA